MKYNYLIIITVQFHAAHAVHQATEVHHAATHVLAVGFQFIHVVRACFHTTFVLIAKGASNIIQTSSLKLSSHQSLVAFDVTFHVFSSQEENSYNWFDIQFESAHTLYV